MVFKNKAELLANFCHLHATFSFYGWCVLLCRFSFFHAFHFLIYCWKVVSEYCEVLINRHRPGFNSTIRVCKLPNRVNFQCGQILASIQLQLCVRWSRYHSSIIFSQISLLIRHYYRVAYRFYELWISSREEAYFFYVIRGFLYYENSKLVRYPNLSVFGNSHCLYIKWQ